MLNKYLEQLKSGKLQIEALEKEIFFVLNENKMLSPENNDFLKNMLLMIRKLNDSIVKQEKSDAKKNLQELIKMLNSMTLDFFNILKEKEDIDKKLTDKYSLTPEETLKVFETNEAEMNFLKNEISKKSADFNFEF